MEHIQPYQNSIRRSPYCIVCCFKCLEMGIDLRRPLALINQLWNAMRRKTMLYLSWYLTSIRNKVEGILFSHPLSWYARYSHHLIWYARYSHHTTILEKKLPFCPFSLYWWPHFPVHAVWRIPVRGQVVPHSRSKCTVSVYSIDSKPWCPLGGVTEFRKDLKAFLCIFNHPKSRLRFTNYAIFLKISRASSFMFLARSLLKRSVCI